MEEEMEVEVEVEEDEKERACSSVCKYVFLGGIRRTGRRDGGRGRWSRAEQSRGRKQVGSMDGYWIPH
jgi:hypothetical protein